MSDAVLSTKELRQFGLTMSAALLVVFYGLLPWIFGLELMLWPGCLALLLTTMALIYPAGLKYLYAPWMKLAHFLGTINTVILLSLVFFLMITPMGLLARCANALFGKKPENTDSYKKPSDVRDKSHLEKPY